MTFSRWFSKASEHWCPHLNHQSNAIVCEKHSSEVESGVDGLVQLYVYTLNLTWIRLIKTSLVTFYSERNGGCKCMYLLPMLLEISWGALRAVPTQTLSWSLSIFIVFFLMWHPNYWREKEKNKTWFLDKTSNLHAQFPRNQGDLRCGGDVESMDLVIDEKQ